ncbi:DUF6916 family protein [Roseateles toxinivorans]|uniref:DUF6916 domain-containing protein n=1 Tax=Roseateles toxinivorans TaxID=270368 RepID=A0A4R6QL38_9BURK|nr:hypothetical protein [Roseateles toxinivorans]TDP63289.1 hypothetical protein DES47_105294 [Roseateles toxinivorans]
MNKREFMLGAGALIGAASTAGAATAGVGMAEPDADADRARTARPPELAPDLAMAKWQHYLGDEFAAPGGMLRLSEVQDECGARSGATAEQFSLLFVGTAALTAGTHALRHGTGQRIALFMQPAGLSAQGQALYRADFNLLG